MAGYLVDADGTNERQLAVLPLVDPVVVYPAVEVGRRPAPGVRGTPWRFRRRRGRERVPYRERNADEVGTCAVATVSSARR